MSSSYFLPLIDFRNSRKNTHCYSKKIIQLSPLSQLGKSLIMKKNQISFIKGEFNDQDSKFLIQKYYQPLTIPKKSDKSQSKDKNKYLIKKDAFRNFINFQRYKNSMVRKRSVQNQSKIMKQKGQISIIKKQRYIHSDKLLTQASQHHIQIQSLLFPKHKSLIKMQTNQGDLQQNKEINNSQNQKHSNALLKISQIQKYKSLFQNKPYAIINCSIQENPEFKYKNEQENKKSKIFKKKRGTIVKHNYTQLQDEEDRQNLLFKKHSLKNESLISKNINLQSKNFSKQNKFQKNKQTVYGIGPWVQKTRDNFAKFK